MMDEFWSWGGALSIAALRARRSGTRHKVSRVDVAPHPEYGWDHKWRVEPEVAEPCS